MTLAMTLEQFARYRHLAGIPEPDEAEVLDPPVLYGLLTSRDVEVLRERRKKLAAQRSKSAKPRLRIVA